MEEAVKKVEVDSDEIRVSTLPQSLMDDVQERLGTLIELTDNQKKNLKSWLKERLNEWESDTSDLHQQLEYDNDLVEGVTYETSFPWVGASNVHLGYPEIYMEIYESIEKRSILGADTIWYAETDSDDSQLNEMMADVDTMLNYKARNEWNIEKCLKGVFWVTNRDGLGSIFIDWVEEYKKQSDVVLLASEDDFLKEFPSPEESGQTEEEWFSLGQQAQQATEENPVEVPITYEKRMYHGCKGQIVDLVNFVSIPATVPDIRDELCRGYGYRHIIRSGTVRKNIGNDFYYTDEANKLLEKDGYQEDNFMLAQDQIEGFKRTNKKGYFKVYSLTIKGTLNGLDGEGGGDERYDDEMEFSVVYNKEHDILLRCIEYPYRICNCATFRIDSRPNRLKGRSIPDKTRDLSDLIDTQTNQRINSRTISTVPIFKGLMSKKNEIDFSLSQNQIKPGRILWLNDFNSFDQFKIQPTDLGESISESKMAENTLDLRLGAAASLLSGQAPSGDPNAPGNKTAMLIAQSNLRMDNPLDELREGVEQVGDICLSHVYQFEKAVIQFRGSNESGKLGEVKTLYKKFLRRGIQMKMSGISVILNPDYEQQKAFQVHQMLMSEPAYQQDPELRQEGLRMALRAGRVQGRNRLLPSPEKLKQMKIDIQKQAMAQMAMDEKKKQDDALNARLAGAKKELDVKNTANKMAEANLTAPSILPGGNPVLNGDSVSWQPSGSNGITVPGGQNGH